MALGSQVPRSGMSRQYMSSRRRKSKLWLWGLLLLVGVAVGVWFIMDTGSSDDGETSTATNTGGDTAATSTPNTPSNTTSNNTGTRFSLNLDNDDNSTTTPPTNTGSVRGDQRVPRIPGTSNRSDERATTAHSDTATRHTTPGTSPGTSPGSSPGTTPGTTRVTEGAATPPSSVDHTHTTTPRETASDTTPAVTTIGQGDYAHGMALLDQGQLVEGRAVLSDLLFGDKPLSIRQQQSIREALAGVNNMLIFSRDRAPNDNLTTWHKIRPGDSYHRVAPNANVTHQFLQMVNQVSPTRLQIGNSMKVVKGPFHARVLKNQYLMDVYLKDDEGRKIFVTSFPVGLGEDDSTPVGEWVVSAGRKTANPSWRNPRTGEFFAADDPKNPIGEYWIALAGIDENTANKQGYGIHGTIEPDSIGDQMSMGCIRLRNEDVALVYNLLVGGASTVQIEP